MQIIDLDRDEKRAEVYKRKDKKIRIIAAELNKKQLKKRKR